VAFGRQAIGFFHNALSLSGAASQDVVT